MPVVMHRARKTHKKSKLGCRNCKSRKIKCDENKPTCSNCIKHLIECDYIPESTQSGLVNRAPNASPSSNRGPNSHESCSQNISSPSVLNMVDLELLHNFTASTCFTMTNDPTIKTLWRINVPQLGFSHDYVMRGILAISALHLARFRPDKRDFYLSKASLHHEAGLRIAAEALPHFTDENSDALAIFSSLAFAFALAKPRELGDLLLSGDDGVDEWLVFIRGVRSIMYSTSVPSMMSGPLSPLFRAGMVRTAHFTQLSSAGEEYLRELRSFISTEKLSEADRNTYTGSVDELSKLYRIMERAEPQGPDETYDVFVWLFRIPQDFLMLLASRTPQSLVIFAYFCVLLKQLDGYWWIDGCATHLISTIYDLLDVDRRLWIRTPMQDIGWIPPS